MSGARLRLRAVLALVALVGLFLAPLPEDLKRLRWLQIPSDLVHVPLLGLLTWALWRRGPLRGRPLAAALATVVAGLLIELAQSATGREASLGDLALDAAGAGAVAGWLRARAAAATGRRAAAARAWRAAAILALAPAVAHLAHLPPLLAAEALARRRFPLLGDFETRAERTGWDTSNHGRLAIVPRDGGGHALRIAGGPPDRYPGAHLKGFPRDWSAHARIEFDARCVGADSVRFIVRCDDWRAREDAAWLADRFTARPQWRRFAWTPGAAFGRRPARPQDRRDMDSITIYLARPEGPVAIEIDNLTLR